MTSIGVPTAITPPNETGADVASRNTPASAAQSVVIARGIAMGRSTSVPIASPVVTAITVHRRKFPRGSGIIFWNAGIRLTEI